MALNLTKLSNAEYTLQDIQEATEADTALTGADPSAYYTAKGNPPGVWIGSAAHLLGGTVGETATSRQVRSLINESRNPTNGQYLGDVNLVGGDMDEAPVAGWDLTTRQPKSISVLWAFGDEETRTGIEECLQQATRMTLEYMEQEGYAATRAGQGGVASVTCDGVAGFVFDHYDTRDGDPQPHKHVVISNRVRRSTDGAWTALDGRKIYSSLVELSEVHENLVQDLLTQRFGWNWTAKDNRDSRFAGNEVDGVPAELIELFTSRHSEIAREVQRRVNEEEQRTGEPLSFERRAQIDLEVWQQTRKPKSHNLESLVEKRQRWQGKLDQYAPDIDIDCMWRTVNARQTSLLHIDSDCEEDIARLLLDQIAELSGQSGGGQRFAEQLADESIANVSGVRTTWKITNIRAEAQRLLRDVRIDPVQRVHVANRIADIAVGRCVKLTPGRYKVPEGAQADMFLAGAHGESVFDDQLLDKYTSRDILDAEQYMADCMDRLAASAAYRPGQGDAWLRSWNESAGKRGGFPLADDQHRAAAYALEDTHLVSAIIGPAGTGKTTTMKAVADAWQAANGKDTVLGLATSRKAVSELKGSIGCRSITIAKLLEMNRPEQAAARQAKLGELQLRLQSAASPFTAFSCRRQIARIMAEESTWSIKPGQLVIIDEAGMVDTRNMARITRMAEQAGAKVILTGDPEQLDSVSGAGGMLGWAERSGHCAHLTSLWRFTAAPERWSNDPDGPMSKRRWEEESQATLRLRKGGDRLNADDRKQCERLVEEYVEHDRLHWGEDEAMEDQAYETCVGWQRIGKSTLLIASTNKQVRDLNQRFILERRARGLSDANPDKLVKLADGLTVGRGDQIVCRVNEWNVESDDKRTIENGMMFSVQSVGGLYARCRNLADGSMWSIPRDFLGKGCEAGYASTVHRSQGMTVDRCAALFPSQGGDVARNLQYVAGTRGREENHFFYACPDEETRRSDELRYGADPDPKRIAMRRMTKSLYTQPDNLTALETRDRETADRMDLQRLLREHDYAAGRIAGNHLKAMLHKHHDDKTVDRIERSPSFEWLRGVWSRAYMTDPKRAVAIINRSLDANTLKGRTMNVDEARQTAIRAAGRLMPEQPAGQPFTLTMQPGEDTSRLVGDGLEGLNIPFQTSTNLDGTNRFGFDKAYAPAVKALCDGLAQHVKDFDQSLFPDWPQLRRETARQLKTDPELARRSKPGEPDWAAAIAGRLNAGLLDRLNGSVHPDWIGGVVPPVRTRKHPDELDIVRQNERLIEQQVDRLVSEQTRNPQPWMNAVTGHDDDSDLLRDIIVYRNMWGVTDQDRALGERPAKSSGKQEQHWANLDGRLNHGSGVVTPTRRNRHTRPQPDVNNTTDGTTTPERTLPWQQTTPSSASSTPRHDGLSM